MIEQTLCCFLGKSSRLRMIGVRKTILTNNSCRNSCASASWWTGSVWDGPRFFLLLFPITYTRRNVNIVHSKSEGCSNFCSDVVEVQKLSSQVKVQWLIKKNFTTSRSRCTVLWSVLRLMVLIKWMWKCTVQRNSLTSTQQEKPR